MPTEHEDGSQNPSNAEQNPSPKYVTAEEIGNIVNAAVTSHLKRSLAGAIDAALKPVVEKLSAAPPPSAPEGEDGKKKGKQDPETLAMAKRLEDLEKALAAEKEATAAAQRQSRDERAFSELMTALDGKVRPELREMIAKNLFHLEKRIEVDENGRALFKTMKTPVWGGEPEEQALPLADGIADFLRSDTAKAFLPAPNPGSGASPMPVKRGPSGPTPPARADLSKPATTDAEKVRRAMERERIAAERLGLKQ